MDIVDSVDSAASGIAAAIGEPTRARMLYCLMDDRARTSTELAAIADVGASTASAHLDRLLKARLLKVSAQGRHRYYSLAGPEVGRVLEGLSAIAGTLSPRFIPTTPNRLRVARSCYDHIAGSLGVMLHDRLLDLEWITQDDEDATYALSARGRGKLAEIGIAAGELEGRRRQVAYGCPGLERAPLSRSGARSERPSSASRREGGGWSATWTGAWLRPRSGGGNSAAISGWSRRLTAGEWVQRSQPAPGGLTICKE